MDRKTGSGMGYGYRHSFRLDDAILREYIMHISRQRVKVNFVFETRTNFIVKRNVVDYGGGDDEMIIDSESFECYRADSEKLDERDLDFHMYWRLRDYWMSNDEIEELVHKAMTFAKQRALFYEAVSFAYPICDTMDYHTVPPLTVEQAITVELDVCTVQQEGEPLDATMGRAIRTEYLYPIRLCPRLNQKAAVHNPRLMSFLRGELSGTWVENIEEPTLLMQECPICFRRPTVGAQIAVLKCRHVFHSYCIATWLENDNSCPMCHGQVYDRSRMVL